MSEAIAGVVVVAPALHHNPGKQCSKSAVRCGVLAHLRSLHWQTLAATSKG